MEADAHGAVVLSEEGPLTRGRASHSGNSRYVTATTQNQYGLVNKIRNHCAPLLHGNGVSQGIRT